MTQIIAFRKKRPALSLITLLQRSSPHDDRSLNRSNFFAIVQEPVCSTSCPITMGLVPRALNDAGKLWLVTRSVFRRRCPNTDSRKKKRSSVMQTNVHPVCPIGIDTKWHGECWPDCEQEELDGEDLPSV